MPKFVEIVTQLNQSIYLNPAHVVAVVQDSGAWMVCLSNSEQYAINGDQVDALIEKLEQP